MFAVSGVSKGAIFNVNSGISDGKCEARSRQIWLQKTYDIAREPLIDCMIALCYSEWKTEDGEQE